MPHDPSFIVAIVMVCTGGWLINNWIRARHGYALEDEWGGKTSKGDSAETKALRAENAELRQQVQLMLLSDKHNQGSALDKHSLLKRWLQFGPVMQAELPLLARVKAIFV